MGPDRHIPPTSPQHILVGGAGPAGLEAAVWLGRRGYQATPIEALHHELVDDVALDRIGDGAAPATIARAVYAGHRLARELDREPPADVPLRREG